MLEGQGGRGIRTVWKRYKCVVWAVVRALQQRASDLMYSRMYHSFRDVPEVEWDVGTEDAFCINPRLFSAVNIFFSFLL